MKLRTVRIAPQPPRNLDDIDIDVDSYLYFQLWLPWLSGAAALIILVLTAICAPDDLGDALLAALVLVPVGFIVGLRARREQSVRAAALRNGRLVDGEVV